MVMGEVDIGLIPAPLPPIIQKILVYCFSIHDHERSGIRSQIIHLPSYNYGGLYIAHLGYPQEAI